MFLAGLSILNGAFDTILKNCLWTVSLKKTEKIIYWTAENHHNNYM